MKMNIISYRKYSIAFLCSLALGLSGCGSTVPKSAEDHVAADVSEETEEGAKAQEMAASPNEQAAESDEEEAAGQEIRLQVSGKDYEICLVKTGQENEYHVVLQQGSEQSVLMESAYIEELSKCKVQSFDELMGLEGFWFFWYEGYFPRTSFYGFAEEKPVLLAEGWGDEADHNYILDINQDGKSELVCNVVYGADGARRTVIYRRDNGQVLQGFGDDLLDEAYDNHGVGSEYSVYLPDENVIEIFYWIEAEEDWRSKKYKIDFDRINWEQWDGE